MFDELLLLEDKTRERGFKDGEHDGLAKGIKEGHRYGCVNAVHAI